MAESAYPTDTASLTHFGFMPLPHFTMLAFATAVEVPRMANYLHGTPIYRWSILSPDGKPVEASNGLSVATSLLDEHDLPDVVFACGGVDIKNATDVDALGWLRWIAARGVALGSLCTGTYALTKAGLLDGYTCASHWEHLAALKQEFPLVNFSEELFVIDRDRITCTGGIAPLDMMLSIVSKRIGPKAVASIADQFVVERVRDHRDRQRVPFAVRMYSAQPALAEVVALMEANIEEPLSLVELAQLSNCSQRQLQRIFREHMDVTPTQYYLALRLQRARELLRHTGLSLMNITMACGFQSACHFSKAYREQFGEPPGRVRKPAPHSADAVVARPRYRTKAPCSESEVHRANLEDHPPSSSQAAEHEAHDAVLDSARAADDHAVSSCHAPQPVIAFDSLNGHRDRWSLTVHPVGASAAP